LKSRRGQTFAAFLGALKSLGYIVEWKLLNAADYGEATTRERLFIQAKRGRGAIAWPEAMHSKDAASQSDLFRSDLKPWRPAREIIDWSLESQSIFDRKKPLASATIRRIEAGLRKFGGKRAEPFLVILRNHADAKSVDEPMPTLTAGGSHFGLCEPFVLGQQSGSAPRSTADPLPTVSTDGAIALVEPFIVSPSHGDNGMDGRCRSIDEQLPTVTGSNDHAVVEPFLVPFFGERDGQDPRTHSISEPLPTTTSRGAGALVQPFIMPVNHGTDDTRTHSIDEPMPTVTTVDAWSVVNTCLVKYNGMADSVSIDEPLDTITAKDRFGLVTTTEKRDDGESQNYRFDIGFRMLRPRDLAAAMGFEQDEFTGNREQQVKQIGNAVSVRTARALWLAILSRFLKRGCFNGEELVA
jgi:DNA (cytosine-5)-methyltransferase 1